MLTKRSGLSVFVGDHNGKVLFQPNNINPTINLPPIFLPAALLRAEHKINVEFSVKNLLRRTRIGNVYRGFDEIILRTGAIG